MKYRDLTPEDARRICKEHAYKDSKGVIVTDCDHCPLRRERKNEKGKIVTLVCFYRVQEILIDLKEEYDELADEEIRHYNEL